MAKNISEKDNFLRFVAFFVDIGTETILNVFYYCQRQAPGIITFPISSSVQKQLLKLPKHEFYIIKDAQTPEELDLCALIALMRSLFSPHVLPCPKQGWDTKPAPKDTSIAADLLRLRNIRNKIVAHCNQASLSNLNFVTFWKKVEEALLRIYTVIKAGNVQEFAERVETYRHTTIEATHAEWCFESLKKQFTDIQSNLQEFTRLLKTKQGPYFRYIKLLVEGGRCCLSAYLNTLIQKQKKTLSTVLSDKRTSLLQELGDNHKLVNQIYPDDDPIPIITEMENWDLYVLAVVIIIAFGDSIKDSKLSKVKTIRDLRLNYAYTAVYAISNDRRFENDCADLLISLTVLSESVGGETQIECKRLKEEYQRTQPHQAESDADVYLDQLEDPELGFKSINEVHREKLEELKAELKEKGSVDINLSDKFKLEIIIQLKCEDKTKKAEAEQAVYEVIKTVLPEGLEQASPDYPEVQKTIKALERITSVEVTCVEKSCLLLTIECQSKQALLSLINFVDSTEFQQHLDNISIEVTEQFDEVFILQGHFTVESLHRVLTNQEMEQVNIPTASGKVQATQGEKFHEPLKETSRDKGDLEFVELLAEERTNYEQQLEANQERQIQQTTLIERLKREREDTEKDFNDKLKQQSRHVQSLEHELSALKRQNKDLETELEDAKGTIYTVQHENSTLKSLLDQREVAVEDLNNALEKQLNQVRFLRDEISVLKEEKMDFESELVGRGPDVSQREKDQLKRKVEQLQAQLVQSEQHYLQRLAESEESRLNATRHAASNEYSFSMKDHLERTTLKERLEYSERERHLLEHKLQVAKDENISMSTRLIEMKIKIAEIQEECDERLSESLFKESAYQREIDDLKQDVADEMRVRNEYIQRNARITEEIREIRHELDIVDRKQTMDRQTLETDLENVYRRRPYRQPDHSNTRLNQTRFWGAGNSDDLKQDVADKMRVSKEYIQRNARITEEIRKIRHELDIVDREQTMDRQTLETDLENVYRGRPYRLPYHPNRTLSQTILWGAGTVRTTYKESPFLIPRK